MISAFGVVHKSFTKLEPKLLRALGPGRGYHSKDMEVKVRDNYLGARLSAGQTSKFGLPRKMGSDQKDLARAQVTAAGNLNRKKRRLP